MEHLGARIDNPKPFFHKESQRWVAPIYDHIADPDDTAKRIETIAIYSSKDLKSWEKESDFGEVGIRAECPDMFELPVENSNLKRWVLVLGDGSYILGDFDGTRFLNSQGEQATFEDRYVLPYGNFYATMTWSEIPENDPRNKPVRR